jgi:Putative beta-barrel porin 2
MNKLVVSVGIIALGSSMGHAVETGALNAQQTKKAWSMSASLRGFYDDNFRSSNANKQSSTGFEVSPSVDFGVAGYDFMARYYEKSVNGASDHSDFTHQFNLAATHAFSERVRMNAGEQFVVGQEPDLLSQGGTIATPQRISGNNYRNTANVGVNVQATSLLGLGATYDNTIVDYEDQGVASLSSKLDRMEHSVGLNAQWTLSQQTAALMGVIIGRTEHSSTESIDSTFNILAERRDSRSLVLNGGLQHEFSSQLSGSFLVGGQRIEFPNDPNSDTKWSPWVQSSLTYQYQTQTKLGCGFSYNRSVSDVVAANTGTDFVRDSETASVYASLSHEIAQHLTGSGSIRYQSSKFNGGSADGQKDNFLLLTLGLAYDFNPNLEGNIGYNFDDLSSDQAGREFSRNKFYVGVTAKY